MSMLLNIGLAAFIIHTEYNFSEYCYVGGLEAWPHGGVANTAYPYIQQYHLTCSNSPQTPQLLPKGVK